LAAGQSLKNKITIKVPNVKEMANIHYVGSLIIKPHGKTKVSIESETIAPVKMQTLRHANISFEGYLAKDSNNNGVVDGGDVVEYQLTVANKLNTSLNLPMRFSSVSDQDANQYMVTFLGFKASNVDIADGWYDKHPTNPMYAIKIDSLGPGEVKKFTYQKQIKDTIPFETTSIYEHLMADDQHVPTSLQTVTIDVDLPNDTSAPDDASVIQPKNGVWIISKSKSMTETSACQGMGAFIANALPVSSQQLTFTNPPKAKQFLIVSGQTNGQLSGNVLGDNRYEIVNNQTDSSAVTIDYDLQSEILANVNMQIKPADMPGCIINISALQSLRE
jgi:hypothetical protein